MGSIMCKYSQDEILELPALLDVKQVAALTGLHERTVQQMAHEGRLKAQKIGPRYMFPKSFVLQYCGLL
jgi:excisionase family DNA binding protein